MLQNMPGKQKLSEDAMTLDITVCHKVTTACRLDLQRYNN